MVLLTHVQTLVLELLHQFVGLVKVGRDRVVLYLQVVERHYEAVQIVLNLVAVLLEQHVLGLLLAVDAEIECRQRYEYDRKDDDHYAVTPHGFVVGHLVVVLVVVPRIVVVVVFLFHNFRYLWFTGKVWQSLPRANINYFLIKLSNG